MNAVILILCCTLLFAVTVQWNKKISVGAGVIVALMYGYIAWQATDRPDYDMYENDYSDVVKGVQNGITTHPLWDVLMAISNSIGISYRLFQTCIVMTSVILIIGISAYYKDSINSIIITLLIYPGLVNVVQIRQFLSIAIAYCAYIIYFNISSKKLKIFSIVLAVLACLIHATTIIYIGVFAINKIIKNIKIVGFVTVIVFGIIMCNPNIYIRIMQSVLGNEQSNLYMTVGSDVSSFVYNQLMFIASVLLVIYGITISVMNKHDYLNQHSAMYQGNMSMLLIYLLASPLIFQFPDTTRLVRLPELAMAFVIEDYISQYYIEEGGLGIPDVKISVLKQWMMRAVFCIITALLLFYSISIKDVLVPMLEAGIIW
ncbi:EpsG family [Bifidobacterium thermophilum]|uniref:EpsG family protein n=1 Tax=Bifidobacterium thermophilum TaxID=33905 RepID=UPI000C70D27A|nr:EpsG family protein [Bifidobacterium thermophilum]PKU90997.1 EpsG family [Bifidobacterium thermophilum]